MELKTVLQTIGIICLLFFGIPIRISKRPTVKESLFQDYVSHYNKSYVDNETEYQRRFENFKASLELIEELNSNRTSVESARYGLTKFSDLSQAEFSRRHLHYKHHNHHKLSHQHKQNVTKLGSVLRTRRAIGTLPVKVDWREKGVVGGVRNQKTCGACWAFSTVETVESMYALKTGNLQTLSVQELIDCAGNGNYGCEGGDTCSLLEWLVSTKTKIQLEKSYPYTYQTQVCRLKPLDTGVQINPMFSCDYFVGKEDLLLEKLANHGPVAVAVNAANWQYYLGGVIQFHCTGSPDSLNHAVQIVGYDKTTLVPHYIVRNSWGVEYGDKGYMYIAIGGNICGLANEVTSLDVVV